MIILKIERLLAHGYQEYCEMHDKNISRLRAEFLQS